MPQTENLNPVDVFGFCLHDQAKFVAVLTNGLSG
jgi:hypothetical protein